MDLKFVIHDADYTNVFEALILNEVKEAVLLTLLSNMNVDDCIEVETRDGTHRYELGKVYHKNIGDDEVFVLLASVEKFTESRLYGLWIADQTTIAVFEVNNDEDNWRVNISVDGWGKRWLPWAQKTADGWQTQSDSDGITKRAIKIVGQCIDEHEHNMLID